MLHNRLAALVVEVATAADVVVVACSYVRSAAINNTHNYDNVL